MQRQQSADLDPREAKLERSQQPTLNFPLLSREEREKEKERGKKERKSHWRGKKREEGKREGEPYVVSVIFSYVTFNVRCRV